MRQISCSTYGHQQEADAQRVASECLIALQRRGILRRLWEGFFGPTAHTKRICRIGKTSVAEAHRWAQGRQGEQECAAWLARNLDDRFVLLTDYPSPARQGDIDGILIGPPGVVVFEVKAWHGHYQASDQGWQYWSARDHCWIPARGNPSQQVLRNLQTMQHHLAGLGLPRCPILPAIVVANSGMRVNVLSPCSIPILDITTTPNFSLKNMFQTPAARCLTATQVKHIEEHLLLR